MNEQTVKDKQTLYDSLTIEQQQLYVKNQKFYNGLVKAINDKLINGDILDNPLNLIVNYYSENYRNEK